MRARGPLRQLEHELAEARIELHEFREELATSVTAVTDGTVNAKLERLRQAVTRRTSRPRMS